MLKACLAVLAVSYVLSKGAISPSSQTVCLPLQTYLDDEERTKGDQGPVGPKGPAGPPGPQGRQGDACSCENSNDFYLFMSPSWLVAHAEFTETPSSSSLSSLQFKNTGIQNEGRLFKVKLVSSNILMDTSSAENYIIHLKFIKRSLTADNDFSFAICDNTTCNGFSHYDQNKVSRAEWLANATVCKETYEPTTLSTNEHWNLRFELSSAGTVGYVWTDNDFPFSYVYAKALKPETGLWLEVCRLETAEKFEFQFFEFSLKSNQAT
eukprot:m.193464 g.193464  ORF g.193464 m.193464 type:complete len:266 (+) comp39477_c0_seq60:103-900(+)